MKEEAKRRIKEELENIEHAEAQIKKSKKRIEKLKAEAPKNKAKKEYALRAKLKKLCKKNDVIFKKLRTGIVLSFMTNYGERKGIYFTNLNGKINALKTGTNTLKNIVAKKEKECI